MFSTFKAAVNSNTKHPSCYAWLQAETKECFFIYLLTAIGLSAGGSSTVHI